MPRIRAGSIEAHKALTRRQILDATHALIAETGSADFTLAEVAAEVGIGRTTLYEYFRDKDDLIASLVDERLPEVISALIEALPPDTTAEGRLRRLAVATVEFVISDPVLGLILHRELPRLSAEAQDRIRLAHSDLAVTMIETYRQGVEQGRLRPLSPDIAGRFINDLVMAAAKVLIAAPDPAARFPEVADALGEVLLYGLTAGEAPPG